jgi:hypothetical protein
MIATSTADPRELIDPHLLTALTDDLTADQAITHALAERIMLQTVAYLHACDANPDAQLVPSPLIDAGWHVFQAHPEYRPYCQQRFGRIIGHRPGAEPGTGIAAQTIAAIAAAGFPVDNELWAGQARCSHCT